MLEHCKTGSFSFVSIPAGAQWCPHCTCIWLALAGHGRLRVGEGGFREGARPAQGGLRASSGRLSEGSGRAPGGLRAGAGRAQGGLREGAGPVQGRLGARSQRTAGMSRAGAWTRLSFTAHGDMQGFDSSFPALWAGPLPAGHVRPKVGHYVCAMVAFRARKQTRNRHLDPSDVLSPPP